MRSATKDKPSRDNSNSMLNKPFYPSGPNRHPEEQRRLERFLEVRRLFKTPQARETHIGGVDFLLQDSKNHADSNQTKEPSKRGPLRKHQYQSSNNGLRKDQMTRSQPDLQQRLSRKTFSSSGASTPNKRQSSVPPSRKFQEKKVNTEDNSNHSDAQYYFAKRDYTSSQEISEPSRNFRKVASLSTINGDVQREEEVKHAMARLEQESERIAQKEMMESKHYEETEWRSIGAEVKEEEIHPMQRRPRTKRKISMADSDKSSSYNNAFRNPFEPDVRMNQPIEGSTYSDLVDFNSLHVETAMLPQNEEKNVETWITKSSLSPSMGDLKENQWPFEIQEAPSNIREPSPLKEEKITVMRNRVICDIPWETKAAAKWFEDEEASSSVVTDFNQINTKPSHTFHLHSLRPPSPLSPDLVSPIEDSPNVSFPPPSFIPPPPPLPPPAQLTVSPFIQSLQTKMNKNKFLMKRPPTPPKRNSDLDDLDSEAQPDEGGMVIVCSTKIDEPSSSPQPSHPDQQNEISSPLMNRVDRKAFDQPKSFPLPCNCYICEKIVYAMEKVTVDGQIYHKKCFHCSFCSTKLNPANFYKVEGKLACLTHYKYQKIGQQKAPPSELNGSGSGTSSPQPVALPFFAVKKESDDDVTKPPEEVKDVRKRKFKSEIYSAGAAPLPQLPPPPPPPPPPAPIESTKLEDEKIDDLPPPECAPDALPNSASSISNEKGNVVKEEIWA